MRKKEGFNGQRAIMIPRNVLSQQCDTNISINECYVTDIGYYPKASHHYRRRNPGIDQNILIYCVDGRGWLQCDNSEYQITAGNYFIVPAFQAHAYGADKDNPWTIYWLHFKGRVADALCDSLIQKLGSQRGVIKYSEQRIAFFDEMYSNLQRGYSHDHIVYANLCLPHFFASFRFDEQFNFLKTEVQKDMAGIVIDYMQKHLQGKLTLTDMAAHVNLSNSHFAALFQKSTGFAPIEYFNHLKIQRACQHLQFTNERIKQISASVGIEDSYYFSRLFKKMIGISPAQYRLRLTTTN
ncbi:MAG: AraC family transcriptional regulator [Chitinophagaceae bacterium]|nr:MAG: AraC family transcriptional regulator [Chitinophagaceae bacterium]